MKFRVSAIAGIVLIGLSAGAARAQQVMPVGLFHHSAPGCAPACGEPCPPPQDVCLIAVPCPDKHECCVKGFLDKLFGLKKSCHKKSCAPACPPPCAPACGQYCAPPCAPQCVPQCAPQCVPQYQPCVQACPAPCAPPCPPPAPKCVAVPVKLMMLCRIPQPAPCPTPCVPQCVPQYCAPACPAPCAPVCQPTCAPACPPACPPGCVPYTCGSCGHKFFGGLFHKHAAPYTPGCSTCGAAPGCSTCGEAAPTAQPAQPGTLPPAATTTMAPYGYSNPYVQGQLASQQTQQPQTLPQVAPGPYGALLQSIQASQERDSKALRDMIETRQATQAVVKALQATDAHTVDLFEKMIQQMKNNPTSPSAAPAGPTSAAPRVVAPSIPGTSQAPAANGNLAMDEMKSILRDLQSPAPAVRTASVNNN